MANSSLTVKTLQVPLLGIKHNELDQEHHIHAADIAVLVASPPTVNDDDVKKQEQKQDSSCCCCMFVVLVILPFLLFVQLFEFVYVAHEENTTSKNNILSGWMIVNVSMFLSALTVCYMESSCIIDSKIDYCLMVVVSQAIRNTVLILVLVVHKVLDPFCIGMELLNIMGIIATIRYIYCSHHREVEDEKEEDEENKEVLFKAHYVMIV